MGRVENFTQYAADCLRLAETEASDNDKNILLNIAQAWVRLAEQTQAIGASPDGAGAKLKTHAEKLDEDAKAKETIAAALRPATNS